MRKIIPVTINNITITEIEFDKKRGKRNFFQLFYDYFKIYVKKSCLNNKQIEGEFKFFKNLNKDFVFNFLCIFLQKRYCLYCKTN